MKVSTSAPRGAALMGLAAFVVAGCERADSPGAASAVTAGGAYTVPRTPWGDPDLQGMWPSTDMVGVPAAARREASARATCSPTRSSPSARRAPRRQTDARQRRLRHRQREARAAARGDVGGPVSPPPHWLERGKP